MIFNVTNEIHEQKYILKVINPNATQLLFEKSSNCKID